LRPSSLWLAGCCLLLAGCGTPGAPQPPSLQLPRTAEDLSAARKGSRVILSWTEPRQNTDGTLIKRPPLARICRGVNLLAMVGCNQLGEQSGGPQPAARQTYSDVLTQALQQQSPVGFASYAVEEVNRRGRSAGLSNQVQVPLAPTLPPPSDLRALLTPDAIALRWTGLAREPEGGELRHFYRVYRQTEGSAAGTVVGEVPLSSEPQATLTDRDFDWEKTYSYRIAVVTVVPLSGKPAQIEGDDSPPLTVVAHDIFPPAAPSGLQAVASGVGQPPFVDLTWAPNTESDLAGYNIYRREDSSPAVRINTALVNTPSYRDSEVVPGHKYYYAAAAVDLRGNESPHSAEASETVPAR